LLRASLLLPPVENWPLDILHFHLQLTSPVFGSVTYSACPVATASRWYSVSATLCAIDPARTAPRNAPMKNAPAPRHPAISSLAITFPPTPSCAFQAIRYAAAEARPLSPPHGSWPAYTRPSTEKWTRQAKS